MTANDWNFEILGKSKTIGSLTLARIFAIAEDVANIDIDIICGVIISLGVLEFCFE